MACKLEFQARDTPHHDILQFLEGGVIEKDDKINQIISPELPTVERSRELRDLVKDIQHPPPLSVLQALSSRGPMPVGLRHE